MPCGMQHLSSLIRDRNGQTLGDGEGQGGLKYCSPWGHRVGHDLVEAWILNHWTIREVPTLLLLLSFISWRLITLQYCSGFCHTLT